MSFNLCIIDDGFIAPGQRIGIPNEKKFGSGCIKVMLQNEEHWDSESSLYNLCKIAVNDQADNNDKWHIYCFSDPAHFLEAFDQHHIRADVVIFDWHYKREVDHAAILRKIFSESHALVFVFSGLEERETIEAFFQENLPDYRDRFMFFPKSTPEGADAYDALYENIRQRSDNNFSFKFEKELRRITNRSLDDVLLHLSDMDLAKVLKYLSKSNPQTVDYDIKEMVGEKIKEGLARSLNLERFLAQKGFLPEKVSELLEFISEKIKNMIVSSDLAHQPVDDTGADELEKIEKLWSYRLYYKAGDDSVRTGDIFQKNSADESKLYLVLTPPCDLERFWSKTHGRLNIVPLYDLTLNKTILKERGLLTKKASSLKSTKEITSLSNHIESYGGEPLLVPYLPTARGLKNYLLFPKEIETLVVDLPADRRRIEEIGRRDTVLKYPLLNGTLLASISQPFLSPVTDHIFSALKGYGAPDYPSDIKTHLADKYKETFADDAVR